MILYHYTTRDAVESILQEGLTRGEAPYNDTRVARAVNLTTDPDSSGHGLDAGGHVVTHEASAIYARRGFNIPAGTVFANKREVRFKLILPSSDPKLKKWRAWSRKNCDPGYPERLERSAATPKKAKTWWLYFGVVPPETFVSVDILVPE